MVETQSEVSGLSLEQIRAEVAKLPIEQQALRHHLRARICSEVYWRPYVLSDVERANEKTLEDLTDEQWRNYNIGFHANLEAFQVTAYSFDNYLDWNPHARKSSFDILCNYSDILEEKVEKLLSLTNLKEGDVSGLILAQLNSDPEVIQLIGLPLNEDEILGTDYKRDNMAEFIKQILKRQEYFSMS
jgi:hypothetical protein